MDIEDYSKAKLGVWKNLIGQTTCRSGSKTSDEILRLIQYLESADNNGTELSFAYRILEKTKESPCLFWAYLNQLLEDTKRAEADPLLQKSIDRLYQDAMPPMSTMLLDLNDEAPETEPGFVFLEAEEKEAEEKLSLADPVALELETRTNARKRTLLDRLGILTQILVPTTIMIFGHIVSFTLFYVYGEVHKKSLVCLGLIPTYCLSITVFIYMLMSSSRLEELIADFIELELPILQRSKFYENILKEAFDYLGLEMSASNRRINARFRKLNSEYEKNTDPLVTLYMNMMIIRLVKGRIEVAIQKKAVT